MKLSEYKCLDVAVNDCIVARLDMQELLSQHGLNTEWPHEALIMDAARQQIGISQEDILKQDLQFNVLMFFVNEELGKSLIPESVKKARTAADDAKAEKERAQRERVKEIDKRMDRLAKASTLEEQKAIYNERPRVVNFRPSVKGYDSVDFFGNDKRVHAGLRSDWLMELCDSSHSSGFDEHDIEALPLYLAKTMLGKRLSDEGTEHFSWRLIERFVREQDFPTAIVSNAEQLYERLGKCVNSAEQKRLIACASDDVEFSVECAYPDRTKITIKSSDGDLHVNLLGKHDDWYREECMYGHNRFLAGRESMRNDRAYLRQHTLDHYTFRAFSKPDDLPEAKEGFAWYWVDCIYDLAGVGGWLEVNKEARTTGRFVLTMIS